MHIMHDLYNHFMCTKFLQLADLVGLVRGKLKKIARMMLSALIVIEVQ